MRPTGLIMESAPPARTASASPSRITLYAIPSAWVAEAQAVVRGRTAEGDSVAREIELRTRERAALAKVLTPTQLRQYDQAQSEVRRRVVNAAD